MDCQCPEGGAVVVSSVGYPDFCGSLPLKGVSESRILGANETQANVFNFYSYDSIGMTVGYLGLVECSHYPYGLNMPMPGPH